MQGIQDFFSHIPFFKYNKPKNCSEVGADNSTPSWQGLISQNTKIYSCAQTVNSHNSAIKNKFPINLHSSMQYFNAYIYKLTHFYIGMFFQQILYVVLVKVPLALNHYKKYGCINYAKLCSPRFNQLIEKEATKAA